MPSLAGFNGSKPARVGNAAQKQLQIDVYGEVIDALHHGRVGKLDNNKAAWELQLGLLGHRDPQFSLLFSFAGV